MTPKIRNSDSESSKMAVTFETIKSINLDSETDIIFDLKFHPDRPSLLVAPTIEGDIHLVDTDGTPENNIVKIFKAYHKGLPIRKVALLSGAEGSAPLMISAAKSVRFTDLTTQKLVRTISNKKIKIYSILPLDSNLLAVGDDQGVFSVWDYRAPPKQAAVLIMENRACDQYIADMAVADGGKYVCAVSGEGTLTAFNLRQRKMAEPQSELFDAGFQSVVCLESKRKCIVGAEDGALNIFNYEQWGNISDRMPIRSATAARCDGGCSVDCVGLLEDAPQRGVLLAGCSDGHLRAVSIQPNGILSVVCKMDGPIESLNVNQETEMVACSSDATIQLIRFVTGEEEDSDEEEEDSDQDGRQERDADEEDDSDSDDSDDQKSRRRGKKQKTGHKSANNRLGGRDESFFADLE